jgi:hypothetical protein
VFISSLSIRRYIICGYFHNSRVFLFFLENWIENRTIVMNIEIKGEKALGTRANHKCLRLHLPAQSSVNKNGD